MRTGGLIGAITAGLGSIGPKTYVECVDALAPHAHWRLNELFGTSVADRIAGNHGSYANSPSLGLDPLVQNDPHARSAGFKGGSGPSHITIPNVVTSAVLTLDIALQVDEHPGTGGKYQVITTGGGSTPGQLAFELQDDGAGGLRFRCWSVDAAGTPIVKRTGAGTVPIGTAFKASYRRHADGTQSVLVDGVALALSAESGADPAGWPPAPAPLWYVGAWPSLVTPFRGLIADLVAWQGVRSDAALATLAQARDVVWLDDIDAGWIAQNSTWTVDLEPNAHPTSGFTVSVVGDPSGAGNSFAANGEDLNVTVATTAGADSGTIRISKAGTHSRIATVTFSVPVESEGWLNPTIAEALPTATAPMEWYAGSDREAIWQTGDNIYTST